MYEEESKCVIEQCSSDMDWPVFHPLENASPSNCSRPRDALFAVDVGMVAQQPPVG